jgi:hypothetical protein
VMTGGSSLAGTGSWGVSRCTMVCHQHQCAHQKTNDTC